MDANLKNKETLNIHGTQLAAGFVSRMKNDKAYRWRVMQSFLFSLTSFTLGVVASQQGTTFLDLQMITETDVEKASSFFTAASFGHMVGSIISGFVHGKVNNNMLVVILLLGAGLMSILTPYCSPFALMLVIRFLARVFTGSLANNVISTKFMEKLEIVNFQEHLQIKH